MIEFEKALEKIKDHYFRIALIEVCDTAEMCHRWFLSQDITATAADIIAMTRLVMKNKQGGKS